MESLKGIVRQLKIQDDMRCKAIGEIAIEKDIPYTAAERIMNSEYKKANKLLERVLVC
jgi:hypothetical protein